ncbi:MAG: glucosaminidase domain-containing protein [Bacilli bacterium]|nr:glucosaminidase domain-containing protein [Bacilli bacterium]
MKDIIMYTLLIIIGIFTSLLGFFSVKNYFNEKYQTNSTLVYNNLSNINFSPNIIPTKIVTSKTSKLTTTTIPNTKSTTKKTTKKTGKKTTNTTSLTTIKTTTITTTTKLINTTNITTTTKTITTTKKEISDNKNEMITENNKEDNNNIIYDNLTYNELVEKLNKNLKSTLSNTGNYFVDYYLETGLDPYLSVAIVLQETGCKWTCSKLVRNCNNIGGIKGKPSCNGGSYKSYDTLELGIISYLNILYKNYYAKGLTTPELINPKYATSTTWSINVNNYIDEIKES